MSPSNFGLTFLGSLCAGMALTIAGLSAGVKSLRKNNKDLRSAVEGYKKRIAEQDNIIGIYQETEQKSKVTEKEEADEKAEVDETDDNDLGDRASSLFPKLSDSP